MPMGSCWAATAQPRLAGNQFSPNNKTRLVLLLVGNYGEGELKIPFNDWNMLFPSIRVVRPPKIPR
jgi:hypothetical protein